jgi:hypothetical protein
MATKTPFLNRIFKRITFDEILPESSENTSGTVGK